jgi:ribosomal protein L2
MNPVDHPNGGKTPGKIYTSKWGTFKKWKKTRRKYKYSRLYILK